MPLSKRQIKLVNSLQQKKYRIKEGLFVVEGVKVVNEFLNSTYELEAVFCLQDVYQEYEEYDSEIVDEDELKKISCLKSPNKVLALFKIPDNDIFEIDNKDLKVMLDDINDPGNLGTIIRLCDWFGVKEIICSYKTVDCYNSKVVQSTMGSLTRIKLKYTDLKTYIKETDQPFFVADMDGKSVYKTSLPSNGIIVLGNEANGVSLELREEIENHISIPRYGKIQATESLNVATAAAILLNEFRRA